MHTHTRNNNDVIGYVRQGLDLTNEIEVHTYVCTSLYAGLGEFLKRKQVSKGVLR